MLLLQILSLQAGTNLAAALLHLTPQPLFQQHCQALLEKVNLPAALLSSLAGAPTGASAPAVPLVAQVNIR